MNGWLKIHHDNTIIKVSWSVNWDVGNKMRWLVFTRNWFLGEKFKFQNFHYKFTPVNLYDKEIYIYIYIYIYVCVCVCVRVCVCVPCCSPAITRWRPAPTQVNKGAAAPGSWAKITDITDWHIYIYIYIYIHTCVHIYRHTYIDGNMHTRVKQICVYIDNK